MTVPPFIVELRRHIGTAPLWLAGASAVVVDAGRVLLIRRADTGAWAPISGIVEPGEHPADTVEREALEEAGVVIRAERLALVDVTEPLTYDNGDRAQYLDHTFRCRWISGEPRPVDGEALQAAWFDQDRLPPLTPEFAGRIRAALDDTEGTVFRRDSEIVEGNGDLVT